METTKEKVNTAYATLEEIERHTKELKELLSDIENNQVVGVTDDIYSVVCSLTTDVRKVDLELKEIIENI